MSKFICGICTATPAIVGAIGIIGAVTAPAIGSPSCMTSDEARKAYPRDHIYWHGPKHCWDNVGKKRGQTPAAKAEPPASETTPAAKAAPGGVETDTAETEKPGAPRKVPPVAFIAGNPTSSVFWPIHNAVSPARQQDPPPPPAAAQHADAEENVVIGAPDAAPGSPDYLLAHCCWPPSPANERRDAGVLRNMIIASTGASGVAIGLWLLIERRRRTVRVWWA